MLSPPSPAALGYRMPAEWEPHEATWLSWPRPEGISFPGDGAYEAAMPAFARMVAALADSEEVRINVADEGRADAVRGILRRHGCEDLAHVRFFPIPINEPWCRDHGPMFVVNPRAEQPLAIIDWEYNAWGGKYPPYDLDNAVPGKVAAALGGLPTFRPGLVMEGGSIELNGAGTLLTTEGCLLHPNRNPSHTREQIEQALRDFLGVHHFLWLGEGIAGDDTDGHIDDLARFVDRTTVLIVQEDDPADENHAPLRENMERLREMRVEDGTPLDVRALPMPAPLVREDQRLPASYANYYVANTVVLLPVFADHADARAEAILQEAFPTRRIVPIDCRDLVWGLGAFHCLTQQQPKA